MMEIDQTTYQLLSDTRCGICSDKVGIGIQCSLCHRWFHIASPRSSDYDEMMNHNQLRTNHQTAANLSSRGSYSQTNNNNNSRSISPFASGSYYQPHLNHPRRQSSPNYQQQQQSMMPTTTNRFQQQQQASNPSSPSKQSQQSQQSFLHPTADINNNNARATSPSSMFSFNQRQNQQFQQQQESPCCPGIEFPKFLPYFCQDCILRCSSMEMQKITEIYSNLLQTEKDDVSNGAPVIFGNVTASFVRKRIRAIAKGTPQYSLSNNNNNANGNDDEDDDDGAADLKQQRNQSSSSSQQHHHHQMTTTKSSTKYFGLELPEEKRREQQLQLKWEKLFSRETVAVLRRVLAVIFPETYDDSAIVQATKAAKAKRENGGGASAATSPGAQKSAQQQAAEAFLEQQQQIMMSGAFSVMSGGAGGFDLMNAEQRQQYLQNKFLSPITFVAPSMTSEDFESNPNPFVEDYFDSYYYEDDDHPEFAEQQRRHRQQLYLHYLQEQQNKRRVQAREQDIELMEMQHEVTLHRLKWMPNQITSTLGERHHNNNDSSNSGGTEVFGPHPVYVNPITSQIRLSEVVIEVSATNAK